METVWRRWAIDSANDVRGGPTKVTIDCNQIHAVSVVYPTTSPHFQTRGQNLGHSWPVTQHCTVCRGKVQVQTKAYKTCAILAPRRLGTGLPGAKSNKIFSTRTQWKLSSEQILTEPQVPIKDKYTAYLIKGCMIVNARHGIGMC